MGTTFDNIPGVGARALWEAIGTEASEQRRMEAEEKHVSALANIGKECHDFQKELSTGTNQVLTRVGEALSKNSTALEINTRALQIKTKAISEHGHG